MDENILRKIFMQRYTKKNIYEQRYIKKNTYKKNYTKKNIYKEKYIKKNIHKDWKRYIFDKIQVKKKETLLDKAYVKHEKKRDLTDIYKKIDI